jgi:hypothetical protein
MDEQLKHRLSTPCWIGGATDAGKTRVARALSRKNRLRHHNRLAERSPDYAAFLDQTLDERWVKPAPEDLASRAWQAFHDRFPLVLEDLTALSLPEGMQIIAEGYGLTPGLVLPLLAKPSHFVCLLPTDAFKLSSMQRRGKGYFGGEVSDPKRGSCPAAWCRSADLRRGPRLIRRPLRAT